jgi:hypothetical protein
MKNKPPRSTPALNRHGAGHGETGSGKRWTRDTRTEAMEVGGSVAGAGCDGIEWMRPNQPCADERQPAFGDFCGTPELDAKLFSAAPLRLH